jgi:hypothetical protein
LIVYGYFLARYGLRDNRCSILRCRGFLNGLPQRRNGSLEVQLRVRQRIWRARISPLLYSKGCLRCSVQREPEAVKRLPEPLDVPK